MTLIDIMRQVQKEKRDEQIVHCCLNALIGRVGGQVKIPFDEISKIKGSIRFHIDRENDQLILTNISEEEFEQITEVQEAMAEKENSEVQ